MKKFISHQRGRSLKLGLLLLFAVSILALPTLRQHFYYPTSDTFINPTTGQHNPEFEDYVMPFVSKTGDVVSIHMGDVPADVIKSAALQYLSPIIRMNPKASTFRVTWRIHVFHYFADVELDYDRRRGEISTTEIETASGNSSTHSLLGKHLTDRDIHQAAQTVVDYDVWAEKHWKK